MMNHPSSVTVMRSVVQRHARLASETRGYGPRVQVSNVQGHMLCEKSAG